MKNSVVMFTLFVFERYSILWQICFKKSKLFVEAEIWNSFEYVKFDGDVLFFCFRPFLQVLSNKSIWHFDVT